MLLPALYCLAKTKIKCLVCAQCGQRPSHFLLIFIQPATHTATNLLWGHDIPPIPVLRTQQMLQVGAKKENWKHVLINRRPSVACS